MPARDTRGTNQRDSPVRRLLLRSTALVRAARRAVSKHPQVADDLHAALRLLAEDAFHPVLRTHKLKGNLEGSWASRAGYDLRVVFQFVQYEGSEAVLLETVGTHEEVY